MEICSMLVLLSIYLLADRISLHGVHALSCYNCSSWEKTACSGSGLDKFELTCDSSAKGCRKVQFFVDIEDTGDLREGVVRQCAKTTENFGCKQVYGTNGKRIKATLCECQADNCNWATRIAGSVGLLLVLAICLISNNFFD